MLADATKLVKTADEWMHYSPGLLTGAVARSCYPIRTTPLWCITRLAALAKAMSIPLLSLSMTCWDTTPIRNSPPMLIVPGLITASDV